MTKQDYFIGLDIGTNSVGWAVTDEKYNIKKAKGKAMWGIRLFEDANTAEERRIFRASRRRHKRKKERIKILQSYLEEEIFKLDETFFIRLNDSKFYEEDKKYKQPNTLFNDENYKDRDYHREFPTVYHLRKALIENDKKYDLRLIYLALAHILNNRGHFLFEGQDLSKTDSFKVIYENLSLLVLDELQIELNCKNIEKVEEILKDREISMSEKNKFIVKYFENPNIQVKEIIKAITGMKFSFEKLFNDTSLKELENDGAKFSEGNYEDKEDEIRAELGERFLLIEELKAIYDWSILEEILQGEKYLSFAKVESYEKHKKDLKLLKKAIRKYFGKEKYYEIFRDENKKDNYVSYIKDTFTNNKKINAKNSCTQEEFCKFIKKALKDIDSKDSDISYIVNECELNTFMPKQRNSDNSVIPNQVHKMEMEKILKNAEKYYPFLKEKDENNLSISEKILKILTFRIPYYVGPLNGYHSDKGGNSWVVKKTEEKIYPWNFEKVVDIEESANRFIRRMTNKCTYLFMEDVVPKDSILYSKFSVLNEINNIRLNGDLISVELKQEIYKNVFLKRKNISKKQIENYLISTGHMTKSDILTGIDINLGSSMKSLIDIRDILGEKINDTEMVENIILWISLYKDDRRLLKNKIKKEYKDRLSDKEINKLSKLNYSGWGRFSKKFLLDIEGVNLDTGEILNIIDALWETNNNLMELLSGKFNYLEKINKINKIDLKDEKLDYDLLDNLYISPSVKRGLWQTLKIVKEIIKIQGEDPKRIFIEVARGTDGKGRTTSRKKQLLDLYKACKKDSNTWIDTELTIKEIDKLEDANLRSKKLYLYYTQMGRCMYSGEIIEIDKLFTNNYDIDHIIPRSLTKDDSILNNLVLVKRKENADKEDIYPLKREIQNKNKKLWAYLNKKKFINEIKFNRLMRTEKLTADEKAGFIARQLVETRQSSKAAADILKRVCKDSEIVYVKARHVSDFRHDFNLLKCREINDYHHAKDAYLNIVVGNVYHIKFTKDPRNFMKNSKYREYNLKTLFDNKYNIKRNGEIAWDKDNSIKIVKKHINKNNILYTRQSFEKRGEFFDQQIMPKGKGQHPIKTKDNRLLNIEKYGGYNKVKGAYMVLVEHREKKKLVRTLEFVPIYLADKIEKDENLLEDYLINNLKLKEINIIRRKVLMHSLLEIDGFKAHVTGRTGKQILLANAIQLCIDSEKEMYIRNLIKFKQRFENSKLKIDEIKVSKGDDINREKNIELYDEFIYKLTKTIYEKKLSYMGNTLIENRDKFIDLSLEKQVLLLLEILKVFQTNRMASDLRYIGGAKSSGLLLNNKNISNNERVFVIDQSPTGIFEKKEDLFK